MNKDAIVLIPSYQPAKSIVNLINSIIDDGFNVVLVDDGSGDQYKEIFSLCNRVIKLIQYEENKGKGYALKEGIKFIKDELPDIKFIITVDGDGQHSIKDINRIYQKSKNKGKSVIGERKFDTKIPIKSKLGNGLSKFTQGLVTSRYMRDNQCGLRCFTISDCEFLVNISGSRYEYEMNVISHYLRKEISFETIFIDTIYEGNNECSHFRAVQDTLRINGSILLRGLSNILCSIICVILSFIFYKFVFFEQALNVEMAIFATFGIGLIFKIITTIIINKPVNFYKIIYRSVVYQAMFFIALILTTELLTRICGMPIYFSYIVCYILSLVPIYYAIKGTAIVFEAKNYDDE